MSDGITKWLEELGLAKYIKVFTENDIDLEVVPHLTDVDLEKLGLSLGHRRKLQGAAQALGETQLTAREARPPTTDADTSRAGEAERRQLTVMFCDLAGSTELSQRLDAEDLREVNRTYQDACKAAIERYDGYVARYMGDGVLAYFGYPQAHEEDAERAIHAGLGVVEAMGDINDIMGDKKEIKLGVRVGIATGPVVVGDLIGEGASQESAVVGETPNLAARLQALASPNAVVVGPSTHALVMGRFECESLGDRELKGIAEPVHAWRVIAATTPESRFEAAHRTGLTPLVGREHEIGLLLDRWEQAKEGDGQVILLSGEAGIGKSRITETLRERTAGDEPVRLRYQCSPYYTNSALYPVIQQLERAAQFEAEDTNELKLDKLESLLAQGIPDAETVVPLLAPLLAITVTGRYAPLEMTPERQKEQTLEALVAQAGGLSRHQPVLLIFEDIHWADPTSLELLELAMERAQRIPMLVVLTYRPEFFPPWSGYTHVTSLTLNRFTRHLASAMVAGVTGGKPLPDEVLEQIIEKTDGVPLFVEELTKTILESGLLTEEFNRYLAAGPLREVTIPATLHDSLMARLDRLGAVKEVAQTASAIGREFDYDLLAAVSPLSFEKLRDSLNQLIDAELVFRRGHSEEGVYIFKHALVQDAAYGSLLRSKRQELHGRIAQMLQDRFPERVESEPELLAHHFAEAGLPEPAVGYWMQAGRRAVGRSASQEAVGHLTNGLTALLTLPKSTERDRMELDIQLALIWCVTATRGYGSDEANSVAARARDLCELLGESEKLVSVLYAECVKYGTAGEHRLWKKTAEEVVCLSQRHGNIAGAMDGHTMHGWAALNLGEFSLMQTHADQLLRLYNPDERHSYRTGSTVDLWVRGLTLQAYPLWYGGFPDQSVATFDRAVAHAREIEQDTSLAWALHLAGAMPAALRRDISCAENLATALTDLGEDGRASPVDLAWGRVFAGWATGKRGELKQGVSTLCEGLSYLKRHGVAVFRTAHLLLLAELYIDDGDLTSASSSLDEASALASSFGERLSDVEILRLKAEVCFRSRPEAAEQAESLLIEAIEVARVQEAKPLELRSSVGLGKLWQGQDKQQKARDLVAPIYDWFTEGFDTPDLKEARALLEDLS